MEDERYIPIPPGAIIPGVLPKFKIYFYSPEGYYLLWAGEGNKVTAKQLDKLSEGGLKEVYIDLEESFQYEEYLETNLGRILENQTTTVDQKAAIFTKVSTNVVRNAFEDSFGHGVMGPEALQRAESLIKNAMLFLTETKSLQPLAQMIGHDYKTYEHATKVLWFTVAFLKENPSILEIIEPAYPEFDENQKMEILRQCGVGALLHDIGKVYIDQEILNKNGPLTKLEQEVMKRHPLNGLAMLLITGIPEFVKKAVLQHHEDFNGSGYPMNLKGLHIHILARLLRITDTFDAMTSRRPYKDPHPPRKAIEIMIGSQPKRRKFMNEEGEVQEDRDQGMIHCFDEDLLRKFIVFLGKTNLNE
jgi:HD-GYP domain-containing protein (c-di-GMP phosphodiesterase class II)